MNIGLLTRQEIIDCWENQNEKIRNSFCCPNCRDILREWQKKPGTYSCENKKCGLCGEEIINIGRGD